MTDADAMEWCLVCFPRHRIAKEGLGLREKAGIPHVCAHIEAERVVVNIFLVAEKK